MKKIINYLIGWYETLMIRWFEPELYSYLMDCRSKIRDGTMETVPLRGVGTQ